MTEAEFEALRAFLKARSGLSLSADKRYLVESRLGSVCSRFKIESLSHLVREIRSGRSSALEKATVEAMTTNETFFFRDKAPFDLFQDVLLPKYLKERAASRRLRIWCAAASTGQEPYSLAMLLKEAAARMAGWQVEIIASDISTEVLEKAKAGFYNQFEVQRGLPARLLVKYFAQVGDQWQISPEIRSMVDFRYLNLIEDFSRLGTFDIVYCRNVLIYFDAALKADVLRRIANTMAPDGSLLLGASETILGVTDALTLDAAHRGLYTKTSGAGAPRMLASAVR
ncbi:CheR family methyltransferase [Microvirga arsenatis]|uniref:protein-glutamate O-methyltransferase n=1 Tax=Microvirga arsenatis TaxID=2692265 RepID=A0ABW9YYR2_9HYPH|nr:protein-glutamate O-methyltransferase CheR [Microvirga arsenatis]NBJ11037.1 chemotaxis protein CheR [Microvirga arsenatis]NBJ25310.1 chemotaxis protein CheR [Microvirga arsenatis]